MGSTHEHLEHAEHSQHVAHHGGSGFLPAVAITMAIIAALLAVITMLSHRSHNEHIVLQTAATRLEIEANISHTQASDTWAFFQAKKIRTAEDHAYLKLLPVIARDPKAPEVEKLRAELQSDVERYEGDGADELKDIKGKAEQLTREADERHKKAAETLEESHVVHAKSDRYDLGELAVEIGLVLCSIAMLAKKKAFWIIAIVFALAGSALAVSGYTGAMLDWPGHAAHGSPAHGVEAAAPEHGAPAATPEHAAPAATATEHHAK